LVNCRRSQRSRLCRGSFSLFWFQHITELAALQAKYVSKRECVDAEKKGKDSNE